MICNGHPIVKQREGLFYFADNAGALFCLTRIVYHILINRGPCIRICENVISIYGEM
jgi:hypothetical protein